MQKAVYAITARGFLGDESRWKGKVEGTGRGGFVSRICFEVQGLV